MKTKDSNANRKSEDNNKKTSSSANADQKSENLKGVERTAIKKIPSK